MNGREESDLRTERIIKNEYLDKLPEYVTNYYNWLRSQNTLPKSCLNYLRIVRRYLTWINEDVFKIKIEETKRLPIDFLANTKKEDGEAMRVSTVKNIFNALKSFYNFLEEYEYIDKNILRTRKAPSGYENVNHLRISDDQLSDILNAVEKGVGTKRQQAYNREWLIRDKAIMELFMHTGMRCDALCNINVGDILLDEGVILVTDKGNKPHKFNITSILSTIQEWIWQREELITGSGKEDEEALFISRRRRRMDPSSVARITKKYSKEVLKGNGVSPHKFRSAYINMLYEETHDLNFVASAVGHSNVNTTRRYLPENEKIKAKAESIVERRLRT